MLLWGHLMADRCGENCERTVMLSDSEFEIENIKAEASG